jgi:hypothetical protein
LIQPPLTGCRSVFECAARAPRANEAAEDPEWAKELGGTPEQILEQLKISYEDGP